MQQQEPPLPISAPGGTGAPPPAPVTTPPKAGQQQQTTVVVKGKADTTGIEFPNGCSRCGGYVSEHFTLLGVILAILFFPLGVLCCLLTMEKKCRRCGALY